jgi:hypothetical protein
MAKKKTSGDDATEAKEPAKKKPAKRPAAKKPARARAKKAEAAPAEVEVAEVPERILEERVAEELAEPSEIQVETSRAPESAREDTEENDAVAAAPEPEMTEEEKALTALYDGDLAAPASAHAEFQDRQTADEDRPMLPEISAREERRNRWEERRDRRRQRRDERQQRRDERGQQQQPHGGEPRPPQHAQPQLHQPPRADTRPPAINGHAHDGDAAAARVGTPLGDAAAAVFAQLRNNQPLPVRQLAAMMRKRSLVQQDPEQLWPQLKAELLGDERSYRTLGLRPRIVYRGRDLFAPGPVATSSTADAEAGVATALSRLASATHRALAARIAKASAAGFERLIHAYLVAAGYRDIAWIKRTGGISYASAVAPGIDRTVLLSARSGDEPIDRRGIGELRVGVEAKNLVAGFLFSARELSEDAERELERAGRSIAVVCGDQLVAALVAAGVGVVSAAAPLHYVDDQLLDELLAG